MRDGQIGPGKDVSIPVPESKAVTADDWAVLPAKAAHLALLDRTVLESLACCSR
jgi:hypothetical protein